MGGLTLLGFLAGRQRALATVKGDARDLHSLPGYYGHMVALFTAAPAFLLMVLWLLIQPMIVEGNVTSMILPEDIADELMLLHKRLRQASREQVQRTAQRRLTPLDQLVAFKHGGRRGHSGGGTRQWAGTDYGGLQLDRLIGSKNRNSRPQTDSNGPGQWMVGHLHGNLLADQIMRTLTQRCGEP